MEGEMEGEDTIATADDNIIYDDEGDEATDDVTDPFADLDDHCKLSLLKSHNKIMKSSQYCFCMFYKFLTLTTTTKLTVACIQI